ncbi:hypothetical protein GWK47_019097 [Chionoecetes opilio]|uniref:Uncharacterized protein n=1 Tax=Chionoecetes opilio TaxID=41210 RepID=A0A8J4XR28_CHIOP|nr:hypothetical protein GWK47_019097 [Chionoecetes opilio]
MDPRTRQQCNAQRRHGPGYGSIVTDRDARDALGRGHEKLMRALKNREAPRCVYPTQRNLSTRVIVNVCAGGVIKSTGWGGWGPGAGEIFGCEGGPAARHNAARVGAEVSRREHRLEWRARCDNHPIILTTSLRKIVYLPKWRVPISAVIAQAALILAEQLADDPVVAAGEIIVARYEQDRRQEEEREEERPPNLVRVREYVETIVPLYSQEDFKKHYRMQIAEGNQRACETVEELCRLLAPHLTTRILPVNKKVLATLWLLGNQESFRGVGDRFDLSKSSFHKVLLESKPVLIQAEVEEEVRTMTLRPVPRVMMKVER